MVYLYSAASRLAAEYAGRYEFEKVLQIYEDEIAGLTIDVPHYSWRFIGLSIPFYFQTGGRTREQFSMSLRVFCSSGAWGGGFGSWNSGALPLTTIEFAIAVADPMSFRISLTN